jgi:hypothetical protein
MGMSPPTSFGRRQADPDPLTAAMTALQLPSLGQVHAELVLTVNEESLHQVGTAIANVVANATAQGFAAGWEAATGQPYAPANDQAPTVKSGDDLDKL